MSHQAACPPQYSPEPPRPSWWSAADLERAHLSWLALPIPDRNYSAEEWERFEHDDLAGMSLQALWREGERVRLALIFHPEPVDPWLWERRDAVAEALFERQYAP